MNCISHTVVIIFLCITFHTKAQSSNWSELYAELVQSYEQEQYKALVDQYSKVKQAAIYEEQEMCSDLLLAKAYKQLGLFLKIDSILHSFQYATSRISDSLKFEVSSLRTELVIERADNLSSLDSIYSGKKHLISSPAQEISFHFLLGRYFVEVEQYKKAKSYLHYTDSLLNIYQLSDQFKQHSKIKLLYQWSEYYLQQEQYKKALDSLDKADSLQVILNPSFSFLGLIEQARARTYFRLDEKEKALISFERAKQIQEKKLGQTNRVYAITLYNLAVWKSDNGELEEAELLLSTASNIFKKYTSSKYWTALCITELGNISISLGQLDRALEKFTKARKYYNKQNKPEDYIAISLLIAKVHLLQDNVERSEQILQNCLNLCEEKLGKQNAVYANINYELGDFYIEYSNYSKAIDHLLIAKEIYHRLQQLEDYASVLNNLAYTYQSNQQSKLAEATYLEMEAIDRATIGEQHPDFIYSQYNMARFYWSQQSEKATDYHRRANKGQLNLIYDYYSGFDEATRLSYLEEAQQNFDEFYSYLHQQTTNASLIVEAQNLNLAMKGLALDFSVDNRFLGDESDLQGEQSSTEKAYLEQRKKLAKAYGMSKQEREAQGIDLEQLKKEVEALEKKVLRENPDIQAALQYQQRYTVQDLKHKLSEEKNAISLDFIRAHYSEPNRATDSTFYYALLTYPDQRSPKFIFLTEEKPLQQMLQNSASYAKYPQVGQQLYQLIWQALEPHLEGVESIHLSPDGLLHRVAFGALPIEEDLLFDRYKLHYHSHLRDFIQAVPKENPSNIALFGGAYFDMDSLSLSRLQQQEKLLELPIDSLLTEGTFATRSAENDSTRSALYFNYLGGTKTEVEQIAEQFQKRKKKHQLYIGEQALEDQIHAFDTTSSPDILHIATHGYFFEQQTTESDSTLRERILQSEQALMRSGLVFTGINHTWQGGKSIPDLEDGALTALEISNLNLSETQLVVLSACETAKGDIQGGEGVFGLQRAFKMAGVEQLVLSLWKVPDVPTSELMQLFYKYILKGKTASEALYLSQQKMSKKYSVYEWGAFVLVE
ncbi:MAG: CHAT domain-containing protein [Bacteroidota bacterium]